MYKKTFFLYKNYAFSTIIDEIFLSQLYHPSLNLSNFKQVRSSWSNKDSPEKSLLSKIVTFKPTGTETLLILLSGNPVSPTLYLPILNLLDCPFQLHSTKKCAEGCTFSKFSILIFLFGLHIPSDFTVSQIGANIVIHLNDRYIDFDNTTTNDIYVYGKFVDIILDTENSINLATENGEVLIIQ